VSQPAGNAGTKGPVGANGAAGPAGTTNGQPIFSSGVSIAQLVLELVVTTQPPTSVVVGADFAMTVTVENSQGDVDTNYNGPVTIDLSSNPTGISLGGTLSVNATNGVASFSGLTLNSAGNGYAIQASSGGVTATPDTISVTGTSPTPIIIPITLPVPIPAPTPTAPPTQIMGTPGVVKSKKGVTGFTVGFTQPLNPGSATNLGLYRILEGVKKKRKTVYTKPLKIRSVRYDSAENSATINLAKPHKGAVEVTVDGAIEALDGTASTIDFSNII
jgi:hypothetical protein